MSIRAIVLLGAPGAGKGTIAEAMAASTDYIHVSTGDMLREAIKQKTAVGRSAESYINKGNLAPDDLMVKMVMDRLRQGCPNSRYIFDGFPRTLAQATLLEDHFAPIRAELTFVFLLEVTQEVVLDRLTGRRICRKCGAIFHIRNILPKEPGICDHCGGQLYQRPDDMKATILNRLKMFHQQTADLIAYYDNKGILVRIDSSRHKDQTLADIMKVLTTATHVRSKSVSSRV